MMIDISSFYISSCHFLNWSINNSSSSGTPLTSSLWPWYIVAGVIVALSVLSGIPANITVIIKLSRHLHGSSISQRLFFSLAVSDVLCLLCLPVGVVIFINGRCLSHAACQCYFFFFFFCITSDINILVLISIQRYYQILHPQKWAMLGRTWQRLLLSMVWMLGALLALPAVFLHNDVKTEDEWTLVHSCGNQMITPVLEAFYILFVVLSQIVLFSFYVLLARGVNQTQMRDKKKPRVTKLFLRIIAASLVVGALPLILRVFYLVALFTESAKLLHVSRMLTFVECLYFFNHCLNPFLYFYASRHSKKDRNSERKGLLNDNF